MDHDEIIRFEKHEKQLHSFLKEIGVLSGKKPNDPVNKFKLGLINMAVQEINKILGEDKPFVSFKKFDENDLPTNSDVRLVLAQYAAAMETVRTSNTVKSDDDDEWYWIIDDEISEVRTEAPGEVK